MQAFLLITLLIGSADAGVLRSKSNRANVAKDAPDGGADALDMLSAVEKELQKGSALSDKIQKASVDEKLAENKDEDDGFDDLNEGIAKVAADQKLASNQGVVVTAPKPVVKSNQEKAAEGTQVDNSEKASEHRSEADFHNLANGIVDEQKGLLAKVAQAGRLNAAAQKVSEKSPTGVGSDRKVVEEKSVKDKAMAHKAMEATEELAEKIQEATAKAVAKSNGHVGKGGMTAGAGSSKQRKAEAKDKAGQDLAKQIVKAGKAVETKKMVQKIDMGQKTAAKEAVAARGVTDPAMAEVEARLLGEGVKTTEAELLEAGMKALEKRKEEEQKAKAAALKKAEAERMAKAAAEKAAAKKADAKAEVDRKAAVKAAVRKALDKKRAAEKAEAEEKVAAKAAAERAAEKEREAEKLAAEKRTAQKMAAEKKALAEKLALAAEKAKAKKKAAEEARAAAEKATQDAADEDTAAEGHDDDGGDDDPAHDTEEMTESEFEAEDRNGLNDFEAAEATSNEEKLKMEQQRSNQEYGENDTDEQEPEQMEEDPSASQDVDAETADSGTEGEDEGDAEQESF